MTGADFTGVDIDLLADYVDGLLAGTPDEARVAALIAADPAWRDAFAVLGDGMAEVGAALHEWGAAPEPMPADVAARLDAALSAPGGGAVASGRQLSAVRERGVDPSTAPRRRRAPRWAAPIGVAAAALAFAGAGVAYLGGDDHQSNDTASSAAGVLSETSGNVTTSGLDYQPDTIADGTMVPFGAPDADTRTTQTRGTSPAPADALVDGLTRLRPSDALRSCLDAIAAENDAGHISVQTIDYARFTGAPALIVRFTAANGTWAWASGPGCGRPGDGAAKLYAVQVR